MRFFNTAGPVSPDIHYCIDPLSRIDLAEVEMLIAQRKYFVLHAPRQTGKTSCLLALMGHLNRGGRYRALYANIEAAQAMRENVEAGIATVVQTIALRARDYLDDLEVRDLARRVVTENPGAMALDAFLTEWCRNAPLPTVLFLDEVDALVGDTLISLLRQLRAGYNQRPAFFPQSIIICGVRDVRDYRIHSQQEKTIITGGSAFNIKAKSLRLGDFNQTEVESLYNQHSRETSQVFTAEALATAWELTQGQPWLVNALGYEVCFELPEGKDRSQPITAEMILQAKENLILRRETHLDQLADKLQEERVRRVVVPLLTGEGQPELIPPDDVCYVRDLGLISTRGQLAIANPIYQEVIPRELTYSTQLTISQEHAWYALPDGRLDTQRLIAAFQEFFREHSEHWLAGFSYREAGPQLLMQAFLQRVVNAGGRINREYGLGRGRTDLLLEWPLDPDQSFLGPVQRVVIELKLLRRDPEKTLSAGLAQTAAYLDRSPVGAEGHLVIFDVRPDRTWEERIWQRRKVVAGREVTVWGM